MTALAADRDTPKYVGSEMLSYPVKGATKIYKGSLVALNAGYAAPGATATGRLAVGRARTQVDNTGSDGAKSIEIEEGIFRWANGDSIVQADVGKDAWIVDDQTVSKAATGKSKAGKIVAIDSLGVWVLIRLSEQERDDAPLVQSGTGTLSSGVLTVSTGITVTANSRVVAMRMTAAGTVGDTYDAPSADRVVGAPGTGTIVIRSYTTGGTAATSDTSTLDYMIVG